jgi:hypothetical protein
VALFWVLETMSRSIEIFGRAQASSEKFDYFVCGVAGTLFAYIAQTYQPERLNLGTSSLEPISLVLLGLAFYFGIKQIEVSVAIKKLNFQSLNAAENVEKLAGGLRQQVDPVEFENGDKMPRVLVETLRRENADAQKKSSEQLQLKIEKMSSLGKIRDRFLLLGFLAIFIAKLLEPYFPANSPQNHQQTPMPPPTSTSRP